MSSSFLTGITSKSKSCSCILQ